MTNDKDFIANILAAIKPLDEPAMNAVRQRQEQLTKPVGSLGRLEEISVRVAGIQGRTRPQTARKTIVVMAADHGVTQEGVSAFPAEVTPQMVLNFLRGGAAINVFARQVGAKVVVVDMGVATDLPRHPDLVNRKVAYGTANLAQQPAMSQEQTLLAVRHGIELAQELAANSDLLATGDMGIGNTTASSAIVAAFTNLPVAHVTGRGTGLDDAGLQNKVKIIERALQLHQLNAENPLEILTKVGGFEIAGLVGLIFGAASARVPIIIDGFISSAAALIATEWFPPVRNYLIAAHNSVEIGHRAMLERMELSPLLNLNLRLGEGTGAALAMSMVEAAVLALNEMATFSEAGVSDGQKQLNLAD